MQPRPVQTCLHHSHPLKTHQNRHSTISTCISQTQVLDHIRIMHDDCKANDCASFKGKHHHTVTTI